MKNDTAKASFVRELHRALVHLYDPPNLRRSSLIELFDLEQSEDPVSLLRYILEDATETIKPDANVPQRAKAWTIYRVLFHRYAEQLTQKEVAIELALSVRQLRRQEHLAVEALADYLWNHYNLELKTTNQGTSLHTAGQGSSTNAGTPSRDQELKWLQQSLPRESADVAEMIQAVVKIASPVMQELSVRVESAVPEYLPRTVVQLTTIRQALLSILTAAIRRVPGGRVHIQAATQVRNVCITIQPVRHQAASTPILGDDFRDLKMARRLVDLSGSSLDVVPGEGWEHPFTARLMLPAAQQVSVLVIDDNADTLQLLKRYMSGTPYYFVGTHDPEEALTLAENLVPQIIVLDVMLPKVDGWELLGRLHAHPKTHEVPIIVCTILSEQELAMTLGAAEFIRKPVNRSTFLSALDRQAARL